MPPAVLDPYAELGLGRNASAEQIARAYRRLAKEYHPDLHREAGTAERMLRINHARRILSRPDGRRAATRAAAAKSAGHWAPPYGTGRWTTWPPEGSAGPRRRRPPRPEPPEPHFGDSRWATLGVSVLLALLVFAGTYLGSVARQTP
ncbi:MAG: J domain-containing protein [Chloroflexota bacterium]|nr:J domain-containing protein [Chloroflexota bacterium]